MTAKLSSTEWRIIGKTVPGASHLRAGIPNQDAILQLRESSKTIPVFLSVSDGHGSPKCFRSDKGSRFAVKKGVQLVSEFLDEERNSFDLAKLETRGKEYLPPEFVKRWREAVEAHLKDNPFTADEFEKLEEKSGVGARKLVEDNPLLAYGATALTVAVEEFFILYLQLGDGDILNVSETGEVRRALPDDERLFANETTSLCLPDAEKDFRFFIQKISDKNPPPALIMLSTDGYVNSFSEESGFLKAGSDFLELLGSEGHDSISENLTGWLEETTRTGSGDDTTVGIIYRTDAVKRSSGTNKLEITASNVALVEEQAERSGNSFPLTTEDMEDVSVTITIKKAKKKISSTDRSAAQPIEPHPIVKDTESGNSPKEPE